MMDIFIGAAEAMVKRLGLGFIPNVGGKVNNQQPPTQSPRAAMALSEASKTHSAPGNVPYI